MYKKFFLILSFLIILIACKQQKNISVNEEIDKKVLDKPPIIVDTYLGIRIDSLLRKEIDNGFSGSVLVAKNNQVILQNGYGWTDSTKTVNITPNTKFYLASTTKGITGTIALLSEEKGVISINDSIHKFFPNAPPEFHNITIHNMLIHSSGLSNDYETYGYTTLMENVSLIFNRKPHKDQTFIYTGAGYWMTAAILEQTTKMSYANYVRKLLFDPANMKSTYFWFEINEDDKHTVAQKLSVFPADGVAPNWGFRASSGILTDISDFYNYFKAISEGRILSKTSFEKLVMPYKVLKSGVGIGYGWYTTTTVRETSEIWSRGGEIFGHNSAIRYFIDENVVIAILTNCGQLSGESREANRTISDKIEKLMF